ncbi:hypothetical protein BaRGS_00039693 [Batillaria attramentaria]|uniref:Uncharacterized protein n=1 Tax=Batillaria attramentaria TaxID=370345 RepID=A0ABD0J2Q0_9CAEN
MPGIRPGIRLCRWSCRTRTTTTTKAAPQIAPHEEACPKCEEIQEAITKRTIILTERPEDANIKKAFLQAINGLMNDVGGYVVIHADDPHFLDEFDKKVDKDLKKLIPDGSLFVDNFSRHFYEDDPHHVVFRVKHPRADLFLSTLEFHTYESLNSGKDVVTQLQMQSLVRNALTPVPGHELDPASGKENNNIPDKKLDQVPKQWLNETNESWDFTQDLEVKDGENHFQENVFRQAKDINLGTKLDKLAKEKYLREGFIDTEKHPVSRVTDLVSHLWTKFDLPQYISLFSKNRDGGAVYFGIRETKKRADTGSGTKKPQASKEQNGSGSQTKKGKIGTVFICNRFKLTREERIETAKIIKEKVKGTMSWFGDSASDPGINTLFHLVNPRNSTQTKSNQSGDQGQKEPDEQDGPKAKSSGDSKTEAESEKHRDDRQVQVTEAEGNTNGKDFRVTERERDGKGEVKEAVKWGNDEETGLREGKKGDGTTETKDKRDDGASGSTDNEKKGSGESGLAASLESGTLVTYGTEPQGKENVSNDWCVIEVKVYYYHGVIFTIKEGPEAYIYDKTTKNAKEIPPGIWVKKMQEAAQSSDAGVDLKFFGAQIVTVE